MFFPCTLATINSYYIKMLKICFQNIALQHCIKHRKKLTTYSSILIPWSNQMTQVVVVRTQNRPIKNNSSCCSVYIMHNCTVVYCPTMLWVQHVVIGLISTIGSNPCPHIILLPLVVIYLPQ